MSTAWGYAMMSGFVREMHEIVRAFRRGEITIEDAWTQTLDEYDDKVAEDEGDGA